MRTSSHLHKNDMIVLKTIIVSKSKNKIILTGTQVFIKRVGLCHILVMLVNLDFCLQGERESGLCHNYLVLQLKLDCLERGTGFQGGFHATLAVVRLHDGQSRI
jgi:hypothetical protein